MGRAGLARRAILARFWPAGIVVIVILLVGGAGRPSIGHIVGSVGVLLPEVFPDATVRPLLWVSAPPRQIEVSLDSAVGPVNSDLYLPGGDGLHSGVVLYTGAFGVRREPALVRLAEALARSGAVVIVPESPALHAGDIDPEDVAGLLQVVSFLRARPEVDPGRVGIIGFSVGGSYALLAAEDPEGRDAIAFVHAFGAYFDAAQLLREVASEEVEVDGRLMPWQPDRIALYGVKRQLIGALPDERDRDLLWQAWLAEPPGPPVESQSLSPAGQLVVELFDHPTRERVDAILAGLPRSTTDRLQASSPSRGVDQIRAHLYVMHDRSDTFIPVTHARALAAAAAPDTLRTYMEFDLFGHVMMKRDVDRLTQLRDVAGLFNLACQLGRELL